MPKEKVRYRYHEGVGEIRLQPDGKYSFTIFAYGVTKSGYRDVFSAESQMEAQWITLNKQACGQDKGEHHESKAGWYSKDALKWLRRRWI